MRSRLLALCLLAACDVSPLATSRAPIVNGTPAPADNAVLAIRFRSGELRCSGTVIAPHVVLTAAHCGLVAPTYYDYQVFFGADVNGAGTLVDVTEVHVHPDYEPATLANDVTVLVLADAAPVTPAILVSSSLDGTSPGAPVRVVGYGRTAGDADDQGVRRTGTATLSELRPAELVLAPAPAQPCTYDSGGPAFMTIGGVEQLVGVTSRGDGACQSFAKEVRVDTQRAFIDGVMASAAPGTRALGEHCGYDEHCQSGRCLVAPDDARIRYCSAACSHDDDCGALACVSHAGEARHCEYPTPTPGAAGAECAMDADCLGAECLQETGLPQVCAPACSPTEPDCPTDFSCTRISTVRYACLPPEHDDGGCSVASGNPTLLAVLVALGLARRPRRIRHGFFGRTSSK